MKRFLILLTLSCLPCLLFALPDSSKIIWAFPITSYVVPVGKWVEVVQIKVPPQIKFTKGKQLGLLRGVAQGDNIDTAAKGYGKCHLIKGDYNYFAIHMDTTVSQPKAGDLVYTHIPKSLVGDNLSLLFLCASNNITFRAITDSAFYTPTDFLKKRSKEQDETIMNRMLVDIRLTGVHFLTTDSGKNLLITQGPYKDRKILEVMKAAEYKDLSAFLNYVAAVPRRYAGNSWKISETFATWLLHGAP